MLKVENWFRFDLHSHTSNDKKTSRKIDIEKVYEKYKTNKVKLIAVTDHNIISKNEVAKYNDLAKKDNYESKFLALNGVELDIYYSSKCYKENCDKPKKCCSKLFFQVLAIAGPENLSVLEKFLTKHYTNDGKNYIENQKPTISNLIELHKMSHIILIPHFNKQGDRGLKLKNLKKEHLNNWDEIINIFHLLEGTTYSNLKKEYEKVSLNGLEQKFVSFTDKKHTEEFDDKLMKKLPIGNFEISYDGLLRAIHSKTMILEKWEDDELPKDKLIIKKIIHNNNEIILKPGLTTIIGEMGSGKSVLLESIVKSIGGEIDSKNGSRNKFINDQNIYLETHISSGSINPLNSINFKKFIFLQQGELKKIINKIEYETDYVVEDNDQEEYSRITKEQDFSNEIDSFQKKWKLNNDYFNNIREFLTSLNNWLNQHNSYLKKSKIKKIILKLKNKFEQQNKNLENNFLNNNVKGEFNILNIINDILKIKNNKYEINDIEIKNILEKHLNNLIKELNIKFFESFEYKKNNEIIKELISKNEKIIDFLDESTYEPSFKDINEKKFLKKELKKTIENLKENVFSIKSQLNIIDQKINNFNKKHKAIFNYRVNYHEIIKIQINKQKSNLDFNEILKGYYKNFNSSLILSFDFEKLKKKKIIKKHKPDILKSVNIKNQNIKEMSPGERQSLFIKEILKLENIDLLLIDQPEDDLDALTVTKSLIKTLTSENLDKQIIVVTHDPKVVVNADAKTIIVSEKTNNKINYSEVKLMGEIKNNTIAEIIDGKKSYIYKRSAIYREDRKKERNKNDNL